MSDRALGVFLIAGGMLLALLVARLSTRRRPGRVGLAGERRVIGPINILFAVMGVVLLLLGLTMRGQ